MFRNVSFLILLSILLIPILLLPIVADNSLWSFNDATITNYTGIYYDSTVEFDLNYNGSSNSCIISISQLVTSDSEGFPPGYIGQFIGISDAVYFACNYMSEFKVNLKPDSTMTFQINLSEIVNNTSTNHKVINVNDFTFRLASNDIINNQLDVTKKKSSGGSCNDCTPPTIGLDKDGVRKVWDGLTINNYTSNADYFNTHYPMQYTVPVKQNHINVIIYENSGPTGIKVVQFGIVDIIGTPINNSQLRIEIWMDHFANDIDNPKIKNVLLFDDTNLIDSLYVETSLADCNTHDTIHDVKCLSVDIYYTYKKSPTDKVILLNIFDYHKNTSNTYFNEGWSVIDNTIVYSLTTPDTIQKEKECIIKMVPNRNNPCQFIPLVEYEISRAEKLLE